jgi:hypothetical protein
MRTQIYANRRYRSRRTATDESTGSRSSSAEKAPGDFVVFAVRLLIGANVNGITAKDRGFTSLRYDKAQAITIGSTW